MFLGVSVIVLFVFLFLISLLDFMARYLPVVGHLFSFVGDWCSLKCFARLQIWSLLAFFAFLFLPGAFKSFYGRELLPEINSQSAPDSVDRQSEFQSASESIRTSWETVVTLYAFSQTSL
jgi:hypothetical protein